MTVKGILRFGIGIVLMFVVLSFALPMLGIARSQMLAPPVAYTSAATGTTQGTIIGKHHEPTSNPFHVGDEVSLVDYEFRAPALAPIGFGKPAPTAPQPYKGTVMVTPDFYEQAKIGATIPVKFDPAYPVVSGVPLPGAGRNGAPGAAWLSGWIIWAIVVIALGYMVAPLLERILLRESY